jgi:hypothetical protein
MLDEVVVEADAQEGDRAAHAGRRRVHPVVSVDTVRNSGQPRIEDINGFDAGKIRTQARRYKLD